MQWQGNEIFHEAPSLHTSAVTVFGFCRLVSAISSSMSFRLIELTLATSLTVFRMREQSTEFASDSRMWRAQLQRQQEVVRNQGRIGYIG
jgi:hypothetical protein